MRFGQTNQKLKAILLNGGATNAKVLKKIFKKIGNYDCRRWEIMIDARQLKL